MICIALFQVLFSLTHCCGLVVAHWCYVIFIPWNASVIYPKHFDPFVYCNILVCCCGCRLSPRLLVKFTPCVWQKDFGAYRCIFILHRENKWGVAAWSSVRWGKLRFDRWLKRKSVSKVSLLLKVRSPFPLVTYDSVQCIDNYLIFILVVTRSGDIWIEFDSTIVTGFRSRQTKTF